MNDIYMIQRGKFKDIYIDDVTGIDSLIEFDYMGRAEFESGALPTSLKRIVASYRNKKFHIYQTTISDKEFTVAISSDNVCEVSNIASFFESLIDSPYSKTFCRTCFEKYFEGEYITQLKRGCKKKKEIVENYGYMNFWWDIDNDFFLFPNDNDNRERIEKALGCLVKTNFDKKE